MLKVKYLVHRSKNGSTNENNILLTYVNHNYLTNILGQKCDRCKAGHFYIDEENEFGCTPCFCYGHTQECDRNQGYGRCNNLKLFL